MVLSFFVDSHLDDTYAFNNGFQILAVEIKGKLLIDTKYMAIEYLDKAFGRVVHRELFCDLQPSLPDPTPRTKEPM